MSTHTCPSQECAATHREQGIHMWHPKGIPTMTQFLLPEYTPEYVESLRKGMAGWWGVPEEAVVAVMDGYTIGEGDQRQPLPAFKLAPGWRRTEVIEHPLPGVTTYGYKYERTDG